MSRTDIERIAELFSALNEIQKQQAIAAAQTILFDRERHSLEQAV